MKILGLHASFNSKTHDPAVALFIDGLLVFAAEEERFLRYKTSSGRFPEYSLRACLNYCQIDIRDIDIIAVDGATHDAMQIKIERAVSDIYGYCPQVRVVHHADSHCYSAYFFNPKPKALTISMDGYGDGVSTRVILFEDGNPKHVYSGPPDKSLGDFYTAFTNYLGFKSIEGEYKVMGMAAYSRKPGGLLDRVMRFDDSTKIIQIDQTLFSTNDYSSIYEPIYNKSFIDSLGFTRPFDGKHTQDHYDLAGEVQHTFQKTYEAVISHYSSACSVSSVMLAGGCALNVLANYHLSLSHPSIELDVFPAASDRGLCVGNALKIASDLMGPDTITPLSTLSFGLGVEYSNDSIVNALSSSGLSFIQCSEETFYIRSAQLIDSGFVVGWFQGRSEFGPRALGFRSIIANACSVGIKDKINSKIKYREKYRPFAPAILENSLSRFQSDIKCSPYMTTAFDVSSDADIFRDTVHHDGTARVQTIDSIRSPYLFKLLRQLESDRSSPYCIVNTSFNLAGEPIVETPRDAIRTFVSSDLDALCIGNCIATKSRT